MGKKYSQLTYSQRATIEISLMNSDNTIADIAGRIQVSPTTVAREIKRHTKVVPPRDGKPRTCRFKAKGCNVKRGCRSRFCTKDSCHGCSVICGGPECPGYEPVDCRKRDKPPYVCNGCAKKSFCTFEKHYYQAKHADKQSEKERSESRRGFNLTKADVERMRNALVPLVKGGGFSPHAAIAALGVERIGCSEKSLYNYIEGGVFDDLINLDLPRKVRYRPRKGTRKPLKVDKACRKGRSWDDYHSFLEARGWTEADAPVVQIDTVEGRRGTDDGYLLTIHFTRQKFQLAAFRTANDSASVIEWFRETRRMLGAEMFRRLFPVILTDNGTEFSNPTAIELDENGERLTWIFYCDPASSHQKGACENNHEFIRRIIPKGAELKLTEEKTRLMMSHINSYPRGILNDRTPAEAFAFTFGEDILEKFGITRIDPSKVVLKPELLKD